MAAPTFDENKTSRSATAENQPHDFRDARTATARNVQIFPSLAREAIARGARQPLRVWTLLRHHNLSQGNLTGWMAFDTALKLLQNWGWSKSRSYSIIQEDMGLMWERQDRRKPESVMGLRLVGPVRLAKKWDLEHASGGFILVPIDCVVPPSDSGPNKGTQFWNALLYHSQQAIPIHELSGTPAKQGNPISRASLRNRTLVPERTQRRYEHVSFKGFPLTEISKNRSDNQLVQVRDSDPAFLMPRQFPNTYVSKLVTRGHGQMKRFSRLLRHRAKSAIGPSIVSKSGRQYFFNVQQFARYQKKHSDNREPRIWSGEDGAWSSWITGVDGGAPGVARYDGKILLAAPAGRPKNGRR